MKINILNNFYRYLTTYEMLLADENVLCNIKLKSLSKTYHVHVSVTQLLKLNEKFEDTTGQSEAVI